MHKPGKGRPFQHQTSPLGSGYDGKRRDLIENLKMDFDECASNPKLPIAAPELRRGKNETYVLIP